MMPMRSLLHHLTQHKLSIFLFLCVGGCSAIVNLATFSVLWHYVHLNYQVAVSIAYLLSVIVHYTANRTLTFKNHTTPLVPQLQRYLTMLMTNYLITLIIVQWIVEVLHFSPYVGIISAIGFTVSISYLMSRFWIFSASKRVEEQ